MQREYLGVSYRWSISMKDEKYKPASKRQIKRILQLLRLTGLGGVKVQGNLTGHRATQLINNLVVRLKLGRGERLPPI